MYKQQILKYATHVFAMNLFSWVIMFILITVSGLSNQMIKLDYQMNEPGVISLFCGNTNIITMKQHKSLHYHYILSVTAFIQNIGQNK